MNALFQRVDGEVLCGGLSRASPNDLVRGETIPDVLLATTPE